MPKRVYISVVIVACATSPEVTPSVDGGLGDCAAAADNIARRLQCAPEVCAGSDCDTFEERCRSIESDIPGYLNTPCLARAGTCQLARACADE